MSNITSVILIILFLMLFALADYTLYDYYQYWIDQIESVSLIVFTYEEENMREIEKYLSDKEVISHYSSQKNRDILKEMANRYHLENIGEVVDSSSLPNITEIGFKGRQFTEEKYNNIKSNILDLIDRKGSVVPLKERLFSLHSQAERQLYIYRAYLGGSGLVLFLLIFLADRKYLYLTNSYWHAYISAGGHKDRYLSYLKTFFLRFLLPLIVFSSVLYFAGDKVTDQYQFNYVIWLAAAGLMIAANQAAWITFKTHNQTH